MIQYRIGQVLPLEVGRGILGAAMDPKWFAFVTKPQKESAAKAWLEKRGPEVWYPTETRWRKIPRGRVKRVAYEASVVPRYIFARFDHQPRWDVLNTCRYISGVVGVDGRPIAITDETLAEMAKVPLQLAAIRERKLKERTLAPGDRARIASGPLEGWVVEVHSISNGIAKFLLPIAGEADASTPVGRLEKLGARGT